MQLPDKLSDGTESVSQSLNRHFFLIKLQVVGITLTDTGVKKKKNTKQSKFCIIAQTIFTTLY